VSLDGGSWGVEGGGTVRGTVRGGNGKGKGKGVGGKSGWII